jgi:uncharacterized membrane protein YhfC
VTLAALWVAFLAMFALTALAPAATALWLRLRRDVPIRVFEIAAGFYLLNLAVQVPIFRLIGNRPGLLGPVLAPLLAPAIYSLSEESLRYLSFRAGRTMRGSRHADGALTAGLGHGGMEALIFAFVLTSTVVSVTFAPASLNAQGIDATQIANGVMVSGAVYTVSRLAAIVCHVGLATLCVLAYRRSLAFLPIAVLVHFALNAGTSRLQAAGGPWWVLVLVAWAALFGLLAVWVRREGWLRRSPPPPASPGTPPTSGGECEPTPLATPAFAWPGMPPPPP